MMKRMKEKKMVLRMVELVKLWALKLDDLMLVMLMMKKKKTRMKRNEKTKMHEKK